MITNMLYSLCGLFLFAFGLFSLFSSSHPLRKILAVNIMSPGVFLVLIATAYRGPQAAADPVAHALVLTGIVVAVSATALGLALDRRRRRGDAK